MRNVAQKAFYQHRWLFVTALAYIGIMTGIAVRLGASMEEFFSVARQFKKCTFLLAFYIAPIIPVLLIRTWLGARTHKFSLLVDKLASKVSSFCTKERLWSGVAGLTVILLMQIFFCVGKSLIPHLNPYHWDLVFAGIDKAIHFGHYPHEFVTPIIKSLKLQDILFFLYLQAWFYITFTTQGYCAFLDTNPHRRMRMLWTLVGNWIIIGIIMATLLSSVGPLFVKSFYNSAIYDAVRQNLFDVDTPTNKFAYYNQLLRMAQDKGIVDIYAISAMPSIHIAMTFLNCLYFWSFSKTARILACAYCFIIFVGSIYFGWHYAIDGYLACVVTALIWWGSGKLVTRLDKNDASTAQARKH